MTPIWTNRGFFLVLQWAFRKTNIPTNLYLALVTSAVAPAETTNLLSDLTEITAGNGYTSGGYTLSMNATDFDTLTEVDASHKALIQLKDIVWTASGGTIPLSGSGARYAVLLTDEVTVANRQVIAAWDLGSSVTISDTQLLTLQNAELDITQP